jgi:hypothetical protein
MRSTWNRPGIALAFGVGMLGGCGSGGDGRPEAKAGPDRPWMDTFAEDKADLGPTGKNPYVILEPGYQMVLEDAAKKEKLTISVLDETRTVDGVVTRVVEEREVEDGKEKEVSRNFLAISRKTGNVYYFGEDAGGAWLAGKDGARFGMLMPAAPVVGMRHYQEVAPKVAMDRAEIVSLTETVETPAGTFKGCLKVEETTPLEPNSRECKLYAPGVGLLTDGGLRLVKYGYVKK